MLAAIRNKMSDTHTSQEVFVGSIDQGTTSTRFLIFNKRGEPVASHQIEFKQYYPQPGYVERHELSIVQQGTSTNSRPRWHEHDPLEIISSVEQCIDGAVKDLENQGHASSSIKAVGITNQRETTVRRIIAANPSSDVPQSWSQSLEP